MRKQPTLLRHDASSGWIGVLLVFTLAVLVTAVRHFAPITYAVLAAIGYAALAVLLLFRVLLVLKYAVKDRSATVIFSLTGFGLCGLGLLLAARSTVTDSRALAVSAILLASLGVAAIFRAVTLSGRSARTSATPSASTSSKRAPTE